MTIGVRAVLVLLVFATFGPSWSGHAEAGPREGWDFQLEGFVIGAWWPPDANEPGIGLYEEAGFNVIMSGRYLLDDAGSLTEARRQLDMAEKDGLALLLDTYTKDDRPWGGLGDVPTTRGKHHPASLAELQWIHERIGDHPALAGYLLGDDQGAVDDRLADTTRFLKKNAPHLIPWICGWVPAADLAAHGNPILDHQIYPTLYRWDTPAEEQRDGYLKAFAIQRVERRTHDMLVWPMINLAHETADRPEADLFAHCPSDSLVRFPIYATVAYGFDGIMHFTYNGGALCHVGDFKTDEAARSAPTPLYPIVKEANLRLRAWAPKLVGLRSDGLVANLPPASTASDVDPEFADPRSLARPGDGKIVRRLDDDVLIGILTKDGQPPMAMVVDMRVSKGCEDLPVRETIIEFDPAVERVRLLEAQPREVSGPTVGVRLRAGEGMLVELIGDPRRLAERCATATLYASTHSQQ